MKRALITRLGAYGDMLIITPVIKELKKHGYYVMVHTQQRGVEVLANNPNIDQILYHERNSVPGDKLPDYWTWMKKAIFISSMNKPGISRFSIKMGALRKPSAEKGKGLENSGCRYLSSSPSRTKSLSTIWASGKFSISTRKEII